MPTSPSEEEMAASHVTDRHDVSSLAEALLEAAIHDAEPDHESEEINPTLILAEEAIQRQADAASAAAIAAKEETEELQSLQRQKQQKKEEKKKQPKKRTTQSTKQKNATLEVAGSMLDQVGSKIDIGEICKNVIEVDALRETFAR